MKRKPKVEKPAETPKPQTYSELLDEMSAAAERNLIMARKIEALAIKQHGELMKSLDAPEVKKQTPSTKPLLMEARTYSYEELHDVSYKIIDWGGCILRAVLATFHKDIDLYFNGDKSKALFWSPSVCWCDLKLITTEYSTNDVVLEKPSIVDRALVIDLEDFYSRHKN